MSARNCGLAYEKPEPRLFRFNNPYGACPRCQGFGNTIDFDMDLVIPDKNKDAGGRRVEPWTKPKYKPLATEMRRVRTRGRCSARRAWADLRLAQQSFVLQGDGSWGGVRGFFEHLERKKYKLHVRVFLSRYRGYALCAELRRRSSAAQRRGR